jgi:hypothetical protein
MLASIITGLSFLARQNLINFVKRRHEISRLHVREEAAAARSTGLRPIHFSNRGGFNSADISFFRNAIITEL